MLVEFLKDTEAQISKSWFDATSDHYSILDKFVEANLTATMSPGQFCGQFRRVFPLSVVDEAHSTSIQITSRYVTINSKEGGILSWAQVNNEDTPKIVIMGFGLHDGETAFFVGTSLSNEQKDNSITYIVLARPPKSLRKCGVHWFGFQAGTLRRDEANEIGVAKRTVLVSPMTWEEWKGGRECPKDVLNWLLDEGYGILVDLCRDGNAHVEEES